MGKNENGSEVFLGQVFLSNRAVIPAMIVEDSKTALYTYNGISDESKDYRYITVPISKQKMIWTPAWKGHIPKTAFIGGRTTEYTKLYVGNVTVDNINYAGAVDPRLG